LLPTSKIAADTWAWRADADRIVGFWDEHLVGDEGYCILTTELLEAVNAWLASNGHREWPKETFGPRFEQHEVTTQHRVVRARPRKLPIVSRRGSRASAGLPARPEVYLGVRFQTADDKEKYESGQSGQTSSETFPYTRKSESFPKGLSGPSSEQFQDEKSASNGHHAEASQITHPTCDPEEWTT
jgi:hypothetical protein